jgi:hypothetical protein
VPSALVYTCTRAECVCIAARAGARVCHRDHGCAFTASERACPAMLACVDGSTAHVCISGEAAAEITFSAGPHRVGYHTMMPRGYRPLWDGETLSTVVFCAVPPKIVVFSSTCFVRDSSSRVSYHVVWDIMSCGIPYHALPCHAASRAMRDIMPRESPCRVGL